MLGCILNTENIHECNFFMKIHAKCLKLTAKNSNFINTFILFLMLYVVSYLIDMKVLGQLKTLQVP